MQKKNSVQNVHVIRLASNLIPTSGDYTGNQRQSHYETERGRLLWVIPEISLNAITILIILVDDTFHEAENVDGITGTLCVRCPTQAAQR